MRYLDPKIDLAFKKVFAEHAHLLKSFLNALLPLPEDGLIEELQYLTPEQVPEVPGLFKNSIVDVKCRDTRGRTFIVEMQMLWSTHFEQRILFSASQAYVKQLMPAQSYSALQPVYALAITNQIFDRQSDDYYHHYRIVRTHQPERVLQGLQFVFVELPKFKPQSKHERKMQVLWLRFLKEIGHLQQEPDADLSGDPDIAAAIRLVEVAAFNSEELQRYHDHLDKVRVEAILIEDARDEGKLEGRAEGLAEGKAEGKAEGLAEGLAEGERRLKVSLIRAMNRQGVDKEVIAKITGMSVADVAVILDSNTDYM